MKISKRLRSISTTAATALGVYYWATGADAFFVLQVPPTRYSHVVTTASNLLKAVPEDDDMDFIDSFRQAEPLPLSEDDRRRLSQLASRQLTMPILFLDAMVPKQRLTFQSADPRFRKLLETCIDENYTEIGMFGLNPASKKPLCNGVSLAISEQAIVYDPKTGMHQITVTANRRLEVQGEPWLDETSSFYMANVELMDERDDAISPEQLQEAKRLSETLPALVEEWKHQVLAAGATDRAGLEARCAVIGDMPSNLTERALWVAALINPLPALGVSLEIRPAMLCCANDYYRILLACEGIRSSINHLSGKKRLF